MTRAFTGLELSCQVFYIQHYTFVGVSPLWYSVHINEAACATS